MAEFSVSVNALGSSRLVFGAVAWASTAAISLPAESRWGAVQGTMPLSRAKKRHRSSKMANWQLKSMV